MPKNKNDKSVWHSDVAADIHVYYQDEQAPLTTARRDLILAARKRPLEPPLVAFIPCELGWNIGNHPVIGWGLVPAALDSRFDMVAVGYRFIEAGGVIELDPEDDLLYAIAGVESNREPHVLRAPGERKFDFQEQRALLTIDRLRRLDHYSLHAGNGSVGVDHLVRTSAAAA